MHRYDRYQGAEQGGQYWRINPGGYFEQLMCYFIKAVFASNQHLSIDRIFAQPQ